jgi:aryl-alcohol dehydrogenase-like predicted oxidoreductase
MTTDDRPAHASGTFTLGAGSDHPLTVHRLGFGAMRITGPGIWGEPADRGQAIAVLRRAVELGVDFVDTADSYGPFVSEDLIREALYPYHDVVVATKGGLLRTGPDHWHVLGDPTYLRQCVEMSLRRLGVERIDLYQLHRVDTRYPIAEQVGVLAELQTEGKINHLGLSQVSVSDLQQAQATASIASVQNLYNLVDRSSEDLLDHCDAEGIAFIPWFPVATGSLAAPGSPLDEISTRTGHTPAQLALAWLLARSGVTLPIPGTGSLRHLEENVAAAGVDLDEATRDELGSLAGSFKTRPPRL